MYRGFSTITSLAQNIYNCKYLLLKAKLIKTCTTNVFWYILYASSYKGWKHCKTVWSKVFNFTIFILTSVQCRPWPQAEEAWASSRHDNKYFRGHIFIKSDFSLVVLREITSARGAGFDYPWLHSFILAPNIKWDTCHSHNARLDDVASRERGEHFFIYIDIYKKWLQPSGSKRNYQC